MEHPNDPVQIGTHSPSIGAPLIQMSALLNPVDIDHRTKAADLTIALSLLQAEVALMRAENAMLRIAIATELEHIVNARREMEGIRIASLETVARVEAEQKAFTRTVADRMEVMNQKIEHVARGQIHVTDAIFTGTEEIRAAIDAIPKTYLWNRFWKRVHSFFGRI